MYGLFVTGFKGYDQFSFGPDSGLHFKGYDQFFKGFWIIGFRFSSVSTGKDQFGLFRVSVSFVLDCYNDVKIHSQTPPLQIFDTLLNHIDK